MSWTSWLREPVFWAGVEEIPRHKAITRLCGALERFIKAHGYDLGCYPKQLRSNIATGLFNNRGKSVVESDWDLLPCNTSGLDDDKTHFYHTIGRQEWAAFWARWGVWSDVSAEHFRGVDRQLDIQEYIWTQLNLERSFQTQVVNELLGISEETTYEDRTTGGDVYLRDAAESGEWGGYRR
jgi:hypothetical protein